MDRGTKVKSSQVKSSSREWLVKWWIVSMVLHSSCRILSSLIRVIDVVK